MPKKATPLTATQIKYAKPREKEYSLTDGDGLNLRIRPTGTNTWLFNYRHPITKQRINLSFGQYPDVSLVEARKKRTEARELLAKGISPKHYRAEQAAAKKLAANTRPESLFSLCSAILKTFDSAKSSNSSELRPFGSYAASAISLDTEIISRKTARSRTISA